MKILDGVSRGPASSSTIDMEVRMTIRPDAGFRGIMSDNIYNGKPPHVSAYVNGKWTRQPVQDKVVELKEIVDYHRQTIGPENADRLKIRIDDLFRSAVRHGKRLASKK